MCTSTVAVAKALPGHPAIVIGDSTVETSGIGTSAPLFPPQAVRVVPLRLMVQELMKPTSAAAASWTRSFQVPLAGSEDRLTVYVWSMLSALPPVRLRRRYVLPSGATRLTTRSPVNVCAMCTSTVAVAEALPEQPAMVIGD